MPSKSLGCSVKFFFRYLLHLVSSYSTVSSYDMRGLCVLRKICFYSRYDDTFIMKWMFSSLSVLFSASSVT